MHFIIMHDSTYVLMSISLSLTRDINNKDTLSSSVRVGGCAQVFSHILRFERINDEHSATQFMVSAKLNQIHYTTIKPMIP